MDQLTRTIKQLPQVLQNEIWEYVRGDRTYWKQQFKPILKIVKFINQDLIQQCDKFDFDNEIAITIEIGHISVHAKELWSGNFAVFVRGDRVSFSGDDWGIRTRDTALKLFRSRIESLLKLEDLRGAH